MQVMCHWHVFGLDAAATPAGCLVAAQACLRPAGPWSRRRQYPIGFDSSGGEGGSCLSTYRAAWDGRPDIKTGGRFLGS